MAINLQSLAKVRENHAEPRSVQNSSLRYFLSCYLTHFDVVVRKLIFEQQAFSQCIRIALMYRIRSTIDLEDIVLVCRDPIFHETPHHSPETRLLGTNPTMERIGEFCAKLALID